MVHALLEEHGWAVQDLGSDARRLQRPGSFAGDVNLLPAQRYQPLSGENPDVHVRALLVGGKLFVHLVSSTKSVQLSLQVSEFVKPRGQKSEERDTDQGRVLYTGGWRCNLEILRWRLERNLFPEFSSGTSSVTSDAELSRLPEPLLARIGTFLSVPDFCRVTQTSKYLHQLQGDSELWQQFLLRDYPSVHTAGGEPKAVYREHWAYLKRMEAWNQYDSERRLQEFMLRQQAHWRWRTGGRLPAPPLHPPMPPPFLPLGEDPWTLRPPHHPGLFGDGDLEFLREPFTFYRDPAYPDFFY
ncbi:putative F-box protein [Phytophthora cinnamomi]|uniref:putative F-box protein n=1 Tax=Phytophthora cinnamomi TaxID=4785 RepID=UPI0035595AE4|nr:putative F-box protein [Phytophthora cinnamomi]